nr:hypothetical protein [Streptomyces sp. REN17]
MAQDTCRSGPVCKRLPSRAWQKLFTGAGAGAGAGTRGHRLYDWAPADIADDRPGHHQLLVRRNRRTPLLENLVAVGCLGCRTGHGFRGYAHR